MIEDWGTNMSFISYLINGISLGSVYAIIALGYTMVYGIAKMLNFAHGDVIMIGAYVAITAITGAGLPPVVAVLLDVYKRQRLRCPEPRRIGLSELMRQER